MDYGNLPYISVIITAYDRKEFLLSAIKSAVNQTLDKKHYEIIVIKNFQDEYIDNYLMENDIKGVVSNDTSLGGKLVEALNVAKGEVISFLEDDDLFVQGKLSKVFRLFSDTPNLFYYHHDQLFCDKHSTPISFNRHLYESPRDLVLNNRNHINFMRTIKNLRADFRSLVFNMSSISVRRDIFNGKLGYLRKITGHMDDLMFFLTISYSGEAVLMNSSEKLTIYRVHNQNMSLKPTNVSGKDLWNFKLKQNIEFVKSSKVIKDIMNETEFSNISEARYSFDLVILSNIEKKPKSMLIQIWKLFAKRYFIIMNHDLRQRLVFYVRYLMYASFYFLSPKFPAVYNIRKLFPNVEEFKH